ncbi:FAD-binding oxidoreductase [Luedemannella helvata]|uniref:FAD-binding oxidoreductase n=1 Tax=Luedemannella helvata TaxID=349315 RepID=A0ABN2JUD1_9ACTN
MGRGPVAVTPNNLGVRLTRFQGWARGPGGGTLGDMMTTQVFSRLDSLLSSRCTVIQPGEPGWDAARMAWNVAVDQQPVAVVTVREVTDVATVVRLAGEAGIPVAAQPGGHGATRALDGAVLVRTSALTEITIDRVARTARVGAGVKWGTLLPHLDGTGLIALAGSSPDVSVVGYLLGGGMSWFSRKYGPASRSVRAVELVTAAGEPTRVTEHSDPDLFWALRGGGGDFGIVTAIEFDLYEEPALTGGKLMFPAEQAAAVLTAVARVQAGAPRELTLWAAVTHFPPLPEVPQSLRGNSFAVVDVTFLGPVPALADLLAPIRAAGTAVVDTVDVVPIGRLGEVAAEPVDPMPAMDLGVLLHRFDEDVIGRLLSVAGGRTPLTTVSVRHLAGAMAEPGRDGVAGHYEETHLLFAMGVPANHELAAAIDVAFAELRRALGDVASARVPFNFLGLQDIEEAYDDKELARLRDIKRDRDPRGVIRSNHPVDAGTSAPGPDGRELS